MIPSPHARRRGPPPAECQPRAGARADGLLRALARHVSAPAARLRPVAAALRAGRDAWPAWGPGWSVPQTMLDPLPWQLAADGADRAGLR